MKIIGLRSYEKQDKKTGAMVRNYIVSCSEPYAPDYGEGVEVKEHFLSAGCVAKSGFVPMMGDNLIFSMAVGRSYGDKPAEPYVERYFSMPTAANPAK